MTHWEVANRITLPWVRSGIIGGTVLGLGRALGETIAVVLVGGASLRIAPNIYQPFGTIAATILSQLDGAQADGTGFAVATLAELALVLAVISVAVNLAARAIITRTGRRRGPRGERRMTTNTTLAGGPSTRRRRVSSVGFRVFTYGCADPHHRPGGVDPARRPVPRARPLALERAVDAAHRRPAVGCATRSSAPCSSWWAC